MIRIEKNRVRWELDPNFAPLLDEILVSEKSRVKESAAKLVAIHSAGGKEFFIKRYRHDAFKFRPLKFFFKPSQARQEWRLAQELEKLDLPIVKHVALGECWSGRGLLESILITEKFDGKPLNLIPQFEPARVLKFVEALHQRGVLQRDLHPGNILASPDCSELRLVDLHGIEIKPLLTDEEKAVNIAYLRIFLPLPVSADVAKRSGQLRKKVFEKRSRRALKENRDFARKTFGGLDWQVRLPLLNPAGRGILAAPDEFLANRAEILKRGRSSTVGKADDLVLKRFNLRKALSLFKDLFRRSRAARAFRKAYHLELAGIPTARAVAFTERRACGFLLRSYLLMEEIPGATELRKWRGEKSSAVSSAENLIAKMHAAGFTHRDLKETNLVFDSSGKLFLIDLEGLEFVGEVSTQRASADLARFARAVDSLKQLR